MKKRLVGIDVARALAVFGMVIVNFKVVFGEKGNEFLQNFAHIFDGKAAATFVVLAGVGLTLMSNSAIIENNREKLQVLKKSITKRALFLFVIGLSYMFIWPADILHFYGVYMVISLFFLDKSPNCLFFWIVSIPILFSVVLLFLPYENGWNFNTLEYIDFWTIKGFFRNLFYNGFHPVLPWVSFMLFGIWLGRKDLFNKRLVKRLWRNSLMIFLSVQLVSFFVLHFVSIGNNEITELISVYFSTDPMPPSPLYIINGMSIATFTMSSCILISWKFEQSKTIILLQKTGKLALSFYVAHVLLGMGLIEEIFTTQLGEYNIEFSLLYAVIFNLICVLFAHFWLKHKKMGPIEFLMRKITS
jgi:uncharacterized membrane protein YeiB